MYSRDVPYWALWGVLLWNKHDITDGLEVSCTAWPWVSKKQKLKKKPTPKYLHIVCMCYECVQARTAVVLRAAASGQSGLNHSEARRAAHRGLGAQVGITDCITRETRFTARDFEDGETHTGTLRSHLPQWYRGQQLLVWLRSTARISPCEHAGMGSMHDSHTARTNRHDTTDLFLTCVVVKPSKMNANGRPWILVNQQYRSEV